MKKFLHGLQAPPSVAIVILNWNGKDFLAKFLPSVLSTDYLNYKVIIADNASTDNSVSFLKEYYPNVRIILLTQNLGFAGGYNEALKQVDAQYYVLLNSDIEVTPGWLTPIIHLMENDSFIAACQPKLRAYDDKQFFEYSGGAGGWLDAYGYPFARGRIFDICEKDVGQYDTTEEVFWASGAALIVRSAAFHEVRGFDSYFFAHQEEIDLCWRLKLAGQKIYCCTQSIVYHVGGGTLPKGNSRKTYLNFRNNQILLAKNLPFQEACWKIPFRIMLDNLSAIKGLLSGDAGYFLAIIKSHFAFYCWLVFVKKSKTLKKKRTKELKGLYQGNLVWQHFVKGKKTFKEAILEK